MDLSSKKSYYMLITACSKLQDSYTNEVQTSRLEDALYLRDYDIIKFKNGNNYTSFYAYKENFENNNILRYDVIELMDTFYQSSVIVKYFNESKIKKVFKDGSEKSVNLTTYNGDSDNSFFNETLSFSIEDDQDFFLPKKKGDFKKGMIVEVKNNINQWIPMEVKDVDKEYDNMYKLLIKYNKIRCIK